MSNKTNLQQIIMNAALGSGLAKTKIEAKALADEINLTVHYSLKSGEKVFIPKVGTITRKLSNRNTGVSKPPKHRLSIKSSSYIA